MFSGVHHVKEITREHAESLQQLKKVKSEPSDTKWNLHEGVTTLMKTLDESVPGLMLMMTLYLLSTISLEILQKANMVKLWSDRFR